jgi:hypothetical protein
MNHGGRGRLTWAHVILATTLAVPAFSHSAIGEDNLLSPDPSPLADASSDRAASNELNASLQPDTSLRLADNDADVLTDAFTTPPSPEVPLTLALADADGGRKLTDELPPVVVVGQEGSGLKEEERIGSYAQPRWTAHRRFPSTRVYVRPEGEIDFEEWLRIKSNRGEKPQFEHRQEVEIGLPYRFQFDIYMIETHQGGDFFFDQSFELRYAFADWDRLPGNPTVYFEIVNRTAGRPEKFELKGLFGGEVAPLWHWGVNTVWEQEMGDARETVLELTTGVSYSLIDSKFAVGAEGKFEIANENDNRSTWQENLRLGPSVQWRPTPWFHVDFAPLFGLNRHSSRVDAFLVAGIEF